MCMGEGGWSLIRHAWGGAGTKWDIRGILSIMPEQFVGRSDKPV